RTLTIVVGLKGRIIKLEGREFASRRSRHNGIGDLQETAGPFFMPPFSQPIKSISNPIPTVTGASVNFFIAGKISIIW
ncbi:hypothetical protein, partial [Desulfosarcina sp.]|uniref:hypothetical protein n=1 Tax=Desulfosarcina sp. TaxID=2027861 RepID=UPI0029B446E9